MFSYEAVKFMLAVQPNSVKICIIVITVCSHCKFYIKDSRI